MMQQAKSITISDVEYHSDTTRISKSGLDLINKSPLHYWEKYLNPNREPEHVTPAKLFGKALHCAILENADFKTRFAVSPDFDRRTKIGKLQYEEFLLENAGKELLSLEDYEKCQRISESVQKHPAASFLLAEGVAEQTMYFQEPFSGANCKMRADFFNTKINYIVDIKTTEDASPQSFGRSSLKYRYHVQAAFYMDGMWYADYANPKEFVFIAVEKQAPFAVAVYHATEDILKFGREIYLEDCRKYKECVSTGVWKGYDDLIQPLAFPEYLTKKYK